MSSPSSSTGPCECRKRNVRFERRVGMIEMITRPSSPCPSAIAVAAEPLLLRQTPAANRAARPLHGFGISLTQRNLIAMELSSMTHLNFRRAQPADLPAIVALLANDILGQQREVAGSPPHQNYVDAFEAILADPNQ